jgi:hypothetical protein
MSIRRPLASLVGLSLILGACGASASTAPNTESPSAASIEPTASASPSVSPNASPTAQPTPTPSPSPTPAPSGAAFTLDSQVWWSGYAITVTGGAYNPLKHTLAINATFQNTSTQQTDLSQVSNGVKIVWSGQFLPGYLNAGAVPVGATASGVIQLQPPAGFVVADAVLTFGQPDEHQAVVPLNGGPASSDQPSPLTVSGAVKMGKYVTFTVTKAMLVPAACSGYPDRIRYGSLKKNLISIVLWGVATNTDPLNYAQIDQGYVAVPDGTTAVSNPAVGLELAPKATLRDQGMCFAVPAPGSGSYTLTMHESRSKANGTLTFAVP